MTVDKVVLVLPILLIAFVAYLPRVVRRVGEKRRARRSTWADLENAVHELAVAGEGELRPRFYPFASLDMITDLLVAHLLYPVRPDGHDPMAGVLVIRRVNSDADA